MTCSGGKNAGSMNIVRNGADFQEIVNMPGIQHVLKVWGVKSKLDDEYVCSLHLSLSSLTFDPARTPFYSCLSMTRVGS